MSSRLLWHIANNLVQLSELTYLDEKGRERQLYTGQAAKLLTVLTHHANEKTSEVWISQRTMQKETGLHGKTVQNFLKLFLESGLLRYERKHHNPDARPSNLYKVFPELQDPEPATEVAPTVALTVAPMVALTVARAGALRTGTETETPPPPKELNPLVVMMASSYAKQALERQKAKGTEIIDPSAYSARLRKKVSDPRGELHHAALTVIAEHPEASPEQLLQAFLEATGESTTTDTGGAWLTAGQVIMSDRQHWLELLPSVFICLQNHESSNLRGYVVEALQTAAVCGEVKAREQLIKAIRGDIYKPAQPEVMRLMFDATLKDRHGEIVSGGYFGAALKTREQAEKPF